MANEESAWKPCAPGQECSDPGARECRCARMERAEKTTPAPVTIEQARPDEDTHQWIARLHRENATKAQQETISPSLTADMTRALPGGKMDDSQYEDIELALDLCDAPCRSANGRWLTLAERVKALSTELGRPPR